MPTDTERLDWLEKQPVIGVNGPAQVWVKFWLTRRTIDSAMETGGHTALWASDPSTPSNWPEGLGPHEQS